MLEVAGRGIRTKCGKHTETVGAGWGELRVGPRGALTRTVPYLAREGGCVRGQALPCREGATALSRRIFPKRKRPSGALWGTLQSPLHPGCQALPQGCGGNQAQILSTKHRGESAQHTETTGTNRGECNSERQETKGSGKSMNQGRPPSCARRPIAQRRVSA